jgi:hypothetical protein
VRRDSGQSEQGKTEQHGGLVAGAPAALTLRGTYPLAQEPEYTAGLGRPAGHTFRIITGVSEGPWNHKTLSGDTRE